MKALIRKELGILSVKWMEFQEFFRRNWGSWIRENLCPRQGPSSRAASPISWLHLPDPTWHGKPCPGFPYYIVLVCLPISGCLSSLPRRLTPKEAHPTPTPAGGGGEVGDGIYLAGDLEIS